MKNKLVLVGQVIFLVLILYFYFVDPFDVKREYDLGWTMLLSSFLAVIGEIIVYKKVGFTKRKGYLQIVKMCFFILLCVLYLLLAFIIFISNFLFK